MTLKVRYHP